jgi:N-acetylglucosamine kinase-like BadF-type ATPase
VAWLERTAQPQSLTQSVAKPATVSADATPAVSAEVKEACEHNYPECGVAVQHCEQRLAAQQAAGYQARRDQQAAKDAETIATYGSLEAARKAQARYAEIDKICERKVGLDNASAFTQCEERYHDTDAKAAYAH